jgi:hypothetical protein
MTIYVVRRKWHIDVGFAASDLGPPLASADGKEPIGSADDRKPPGSADQRNPLGSADDMRPLAFARAEFPAANYMFFGFGDRHYLLAKHHNAPVLSGALWPGPALILLTALQGTPAAAFGDSHVIELQLSAPHARAVQSFIRGSISNLAPYAKGPYEGSLYFAASTRYSAFHTCNTWAAEALQAGDVPVRSRGVIFASQLWSPVRTLARSSTGAQVSIPAPRSP